MGRRALAAAALIALALATLWAAGIAGGQPPDAALPAPTYEASAVAVDGHVYLFGGATEDGRDPYLDDVLRYTPSTGEVATLASLPTPRTRTAVAWTGEEVEVVGGYDEQGAVEEVVPFDPEEGDLAGDPGSLVGGRQSAAAVAHGDRIFVLGGRVSGGCSTGCAEIVAYDPGSGEVQDMETTIGSRADHAAVRVDGEAYVLGGRSGPGELPTEILRYDPGEDRVDVMDARLPDGRHSMGVAQHEGQIYLFGGHGPDGLVSSIVRYDPAEDTIEALDARLPTARTQLAAASLGDGIYLLGGTDTTGRLEEILVFDPDEGSVESLTPGARSGLLRGTLTSPDGLGLERVRLVPHPDPNPSTVHMTDEDGSYQIPLPPGSYGLVAEARPPGSLGEPSPPVLPRNWSCQVSTDSSCLNVEAGETTWHNGTLEMGGYLLGHVRTPNGTEAVAGSVLANGKDRPTNATSPIQFGGNYSMVLPPGEYHLAAFPAQAASELAPTFLRCHPRTPENCTRIEAGERTRRDVEIPRWGVLAGRVVDPEGAPVPGARVAASLWWGSGELRNRTDDDGRFRLRATPGAFEVTLDPPSEERRRGLGSRTVACNQPSDASCSVVRANATTRRTLSLPADGFLDVAVRDGVGEPVPNTSVVVQPREDPVPLLNRQTEDGRASFRVAPGTYRVSLPDLEKREDRYVLGVGCNGTGSPGDCATVEALERTNHTVTVVEAARVGGTVWTSDGETLEGVVVQLVPDPGGPRVPERTLATTTDGEGAYSLHPFPAADAYRMEVTWPDQNATFVVDCPPEQGCVPGEPGRTRSLNLTLPTEPGPGTQHIQPGRPDPSVFDRIEVPGTGLPWALAAVALAAVVGRRAPRSLPASR